MKKYQTYLDSINKLLVEFSGYLNPELKLIIIDNIKSTDQNSCNLTKKNWNEIKFPNSGSNGVYFIFGRNESEENSLGVYVGKASLSSYIGSRLNYHLNNNEKEKRIYPMHDKQGDIFLMELIVSIPMNELHFLAPALEEFLIINLPDKNVHLINTIGNN